MKLQRISRKQLLEFQSMLNQAGIGCRIYEIDSPYKYVYFDGKEYRCKTNSEALDVLLGLVKCVKGAVGPEEQYAELQQQYIDFGYDRETAAAAALADMNEMLRRIVEK